MADMKGFFKQTKKSGGISKPNRKPKASSASNNFKSPSTGSVSAQPSALIANVQDDYDANEDVLRQFDMNMTYGPCVGMTRLGRWRRASSLGLNPPKDVERLLCSLKVRTDSLWDGRI